MELQCSWWDRLLEPQALWMTPHILDLLSAAFCCRGEFHLEGGIVVIDITYCFIWQLNSLKVRTMTSTSQSCCLLSNPLPCPLHGWPLSRCFKSLQFDLPSGLYETRGLNSLSCLDRLPGIAVGASSGRSLSQVLQTSDLGTVGSGGGIDWLKPIHAPIPLATIVHSGMGSDLSILTRVNLITLAENLGSQALFSIGYEQGNL